MGCVLETIGMLLFLTLMGSVGGWVFLVDVTLGRSGGFPRMGGCYTSKVPKLNTRTQYVVKNEDTSPGTVDRAG